MFCSQCPVNNLCTTMLYPGPHASQQHRKLYFASRYARRPAVSIPAATYETVSSSPRRTSRVVVTLTTRLLFASSAMVFVAFASQA